MRRVNPRSAFFEESGGAGVGSLPGTHISTETSAAAVVKARCCILPAPSCPLPTSCQIDDSGCTSSPMLKALGLCYGSLTRPQGHLRLLVCGDSQVSLPSPAGHPCCDPHDPGTGLVLLGSVSWELWVLPMLGQPGFAHPSGYPAEPNRL